jgi:hypothetical protein
LPSGDEVETEFEFRGCVSRVHFSAAFSNNNASDPEDWTHLRIVKATIHKADASKTLNWKNVSP